MAKCDGNDAVLHRPHFLFVALIVASNDKCDRSEWRSLFCTLYIHRRLAFTEVVYM
jgi:hypothetical protein